MRNPSTKFWMREYPNAFRSAFTLIELLVVVAIIAILASIFLPALGAAKSKAWRTVCINNIKQVMLAESLYFPDNNDYVPWPNWAGGPSANAQGWAYNPAALNQIGPGRQVGPQSGLLWPYTKNARVFLCPVDMQTTNSSASPPGVIFTYQQLFQQRNMTFISYVCNGAVIDWSNSGGLTTLKSSRFQPSNYLFWEADERVPFFLNDGASPPSQGLTIRHDNGGTVAALDDHVEWMTYAHYYSLVGGAPFPDPAIKPLGKVPNDFWCDPQDPDGGLGEGY